jgi:hypothetical protein
VRAIFDEFMINFSFAECLVDLLLVVEGKIDWGKWKIYEKFKNFTLDLNFH